MINLIMKHVSNPSISRPRFLTGFILIIELLMSLFYRTRQSLTGGLVHSSEIRTYEVRLEHTNNDFILHAHALQCMRLWFVNSYLVRSSYCMRLHRFFIEQKIEPSVRVVIKDGKLLHQWKHVLRLGTGDKVVLFDGFGTDSRCELASLSKDEAVCLVRESVLSAPAPKLQFFLFASLIRKERFEWLLEKATELGVMQIRPVIADRSAVKKFNLERAKDIVKEAAEQSGRGTLPALYEPMELRNVFKEYQFFESIAFDPHGEPFQKAKWENAAKLGAFIGPEGGWSARELELFREHKTTVCSLGTPTLRAETAAVAVTALLLLES